MCVALNHLFKKALLTRILIALSKGTFVNNEETSYKTKISLLVNLICEIKSISNYILIKGQGLQFLSEPFSKGKIVCVGH